MDLRRLIHGDLLQGSPPVAGLLGSEFLRRNHGIIDFGTGKRKRQSSSGAPVLFLRYSGDPCRTPFNSSQNDNLPVKP
jgi:hypothetical protein